MDQHIDGEASGMERPQDITIANNSIRFPKPTAKTMGIMLRALSRFIDGVMIVNNRTTRHQVNRGVEEAMLAYREEESTHLSHATPAKDITLTQDATLTGGLCMEGRDPVRHSL